MTFGFLFTTNVSNDYQLTAWPPKMWRRWDGRAHANINLATHSGKHPQQTAVGLANRVLQWRVLIFDLISMVSAKLCADADLHRLFSPFIWVV